MDYSYGMMEFLFISFDSLTVITKGIKSKPLNEFSFGKDIQISHGLNEHGHAAFRRHLHHPLQTP